MSITQIRPCAGVRVLMQGIELSGEIRKEKDWQRRQGAAAGERDQYRMRRSEMDWAILV